MHKGSCLCSAIEFEITSEPVKVSNCHCIMCQKQHGAAYATYARFNRADLKYTSGQEQLAVYNSSSDVHRKFCKTCGSNIEWGCSERYPQWVAIAVGSFDTPFRTKEIKELHLDTKACWLAE